MRFNNFCAVTANMPTLPVNLLTGRSPAALH